MNFVAIFMQQQYFLSIYIYIYMYIIRYDDAPLCILSNVHMVLMRTKTKKLKHNWRSWLD